MLAFGFGKVSLSLGLLLAVAGCSPTSGNQGDNAPPTCGASLVDNAPVTFYGDVFPILDSNDRGAVYKCTTCHADYKTPEGLNSVSVVNSVINSMQTKYMPRGGDLVPTEKIAIFRQWQLQGFAPGVPGQAPSVSASKAASGSTVGGTTGKTTGC